MLDVKIISYSKSLDIVFGVPSIGFQTLNQTQKYTNLVLRRIFIQKFTVPSAAIAMKIWMLPKCAYVQWVTCHNMTV